MCRFLIVESRPAIRPADLLRRFADMAEKSRSEDGDLQGDGWGFALRNDGGDWRGYWSLRPSGKRKTSSLPFRRPAAFALMPAAAPFRGRRAIWHSTSRSSEAERLLFSTGFFAASGSAVRSPGKSERKKSGISFASRNSRPHPGSG